MNSSKTRQLAWTFIHHFTTATTHMTRCKLPMSYEKLEYVNSKVENRSYALPKSVYIHIPFCIRKCFYCDFAVIAGDSSHWYDNYISYIVREIESTLSYFKRKYQKLPDLETVYFGGGTPSLLPTIYIQQILLSLQKYINFASDVELTVEMDPGTFDLSKAREFFALGVNRVSVGVQSFDDTLLQLCGRSHNSKEIYYAWDTLRTAGFTNLSLDLMSGLPNQSLEVFKDSIEKAISLDPEHLSCYDLILEGSTPFGKKYQSGVYPLPSEDEAAAMYIFASCRLRERGFEHYEVSNYGKPKYLSKHNQVYWKNQSYYGFGISATSYTEMKRFSRPRKLLSYFDWVKRLEMQNGEVECPEESLQEQAVDTLILGLRMKQGISIDEFEKQYGQQVSWQVMEAAQPWIESGHILGKYNCNGQLQRIALQDPNGFLLQNSILISLLEKSLWNKSSSKYHKAQS
ncbi:hypothetical protein GpartN1_g6296.t1 [Galdieria partita]|uniref:Radical S-adenosyl methionine domain-containing protein 1, mitochondrial n=1 Tax=Galdieria partita TaxID=83374 RepID=A0A9C7Q259_9RHOD|nr:hypothetical protein GpartN1_g1681.t1 [Galdieria partita]GJQ14505.1 hypothetical protein GpartN1_g6296.t1 [Galdieria partita]